MRFASQTATVGVDNVAVAIYEVTMSKDVDPASRRHGDALRAIRREKHLPHKVIVSRLEMAESTYRAYEQGYRRLRVDQIPNFAAAYEMTPEELSSRLGLNDADVQQLRVAKCAQLMSELDGEPYFAGFTYTAPQWSQARVTSLVGARQRRAVLGVY